MRTQAFGQTGQRVPVIGQGTWKMDTDSREAALASIRAGLDRGMTHIDTAEMYGNGDAERLVGEAIRGRRDEVFLVSKVLPSNASRRGTIAACDRSLSRLGTDRLDCYLLHWAGSHPIAETVAAFTELEQAGKIGSWGVSNFDREELDELWRVPGGRRVVCNQVLYHVEQRAIEHEVMPWCDAHGVAVVAYSPFGQDRFPATASPGGRVLAAVAAKYSATPRQIALAFLTRRPSVFAIPKSSNVEHVADNAAAGDLVLSEADIAAIDRAFPRGRKPESLPML
jgi:diketogulonate reductase-like aldo/keto reductase